MANLDEQPFLPLGLGTPWVVVKDGNPTALALFRRHYSYRAYADNRDPQLFVSPGEKMLLLTNCCRALFVWRRFRSADGQSGINCAVFRNEGAGLSSDLIKAAEALANLRWPGERLFTYVNPKRIKAGNPGYCFIAAGWQKCGITKWNRLLIFEKPSISGDAAARKTAHP